MLRYVQAEGCEFNNKVCGGAAASADLEALQWLHSQEAVLGRDTSMEAARGGSIAICEFLLQHGVVFTEWNMQDAAWYGHLHLCQWLRAATNCPWGASAYQAADAGRVRVALFILALLSFVYSTVLCIALCRVCCTSLRSTCAVPIVLQVVPNLLL
jgi:hypothetical protein